jgi:putative ABC transport system substrate-binding protein
LTCAGITLVPLQQATRTIPIVFASVIDPVGAGLVASMARPGGNATGFVAFEYSVSAKWLELLKETAPGVTRAAVLWEPGLAVGTGQLNAIQTAAPSINIELIPVDVRDVGELERAVAEFARSPNGGLIVTGSPAAAARRALIIALADRYRLPAVYVQRYYVASGGLMSYAPSTTEPYRRAASYVDRILKGEKPADLPVQIPTKYELIINLKTAKALGLHMPKSLLARADEVIE